MYALKSSIDDDELSAITAKWWVPVVAGLFLVYYAFVVLSFTIETVWAVAVLLGTGLIVAGVAELAFSTMASSWRWLLIVIGIGDVALGVTAFAWPGATFLVLARLVGWVLVFRGVIELVRSFEARRLGASDWWFYALLGTFTIGVALWASRYAGRSIVLLVLWVGIALLSRGIAAIAAGFALRAAHHHRTAH